MQCSSGRSERPPVRQLYPARSPEFRAPTTNLPKLSPERARPVELSAQRLPPPHAGAKITTANESTAAAEISRDALLVAVQRFFVGLNGFSSNGQPPPTYGKTLAALRALAIAGNPV